jgi:hypothetical protein
LRPQLDPCESSDEATKAIKIGSNIERLKQQVAFPDVRELVNQVYIRISNIIEWRPKATRFRAWLQDTSERDIDAIIAYHNEMGKQIGIGSGLKKILKLFGWVTGGAIGQAAGHVFDPAQGNTSIWLTLLGAGLGEAATSIVEDSIDRPPWKPTVFGDWLGDRIKTLLRE